MLAVFSLIVVTVFTSLFLFEWLKTAVLKRPPGPIGLPIIGYTPFLGSKPLKKVLKLAEKYDKVMRVNILGSDYIFLNDFDSAKEAFVAQAENFAGRPRDEFDIYSFFFGPKNIIVSEGKLFKTQRKFMLSKLSLLALRKTSFESNISHICDLLVANIDATNGQGFNVYDYLANFTTNFMLGLLFNTSFGMKDQRYAMLRMKAYHYFSNIPHMDAHISGLGFHIRKLFQLNKYKGLVTGKGIFTDYAVSLITERVNSDDVEKESNDLLDYYVKEMKAGKKGEHLNLDILVSNFSLFLAGTVETSTILLYHFINLMVLHPDIQESVQKEIDEVIGKDNRVSFEHRSKMNYTKAVFAEVERFVSVAPITFVRVNYSETTVAGYKIPRRSKVIANLLKISRDPKYFVNPDHFDPRNFLDNEGKFKTIEAHIPYSMGKRNCMGFKLAAIQNFTAMATLLQKFTWKECDGERMRRIIIMEAVNRVLAPYNVRASRR